MILLKNPKKQGKNWKTLQPVVCDLIKKHNFLANIGVFQQHQLSAISFGVLGLSGGRSANAGTNVIYGSNGSGKMLLANP